MLWFITSKAFERSQRNIRTTLPVLNKTVDPEWPDFEKVRAKDKKYKENYNYQYDCKHGVNEMPELQPEDPVRLKLDDQKGWGQSSVVVTSTHEPRS